MLTSPHVLFALQFNCEPTEDNYLQLFLARRRICFWPRGPAAESRDIWFLMSLVHASGFSSTDPIGQGRSLTDPGAAERSHRLPCLRIAGRPCEICWLGSNFRVGDKPSGTQERPSKSTFFSAHQACENSIGPPRDRAHAARVEGRKTTRDGSQMGGTQSQPSHTKPPQKQLKIEFCPDSRRSIRSRI